MCVVCGTNAPEGALSCVVDGVVFPVATELDADLASMHGIDVSLERVDYPASVAESTEAPWD